MDILPNAPPKPNPANPTPAIKDITNYLYYMYEMLGYAGRNYDKRFADLEERIKKIEDSL